MEPLPFRALPIPGHPAPRLAPTAWAWLAAAVIAGWGAPAGAVTYFVDRSNPACSNSGAGTEARPFCSISAAVGSHGGPGVTILVKPGTYAEQISINTSGAAGSPLALKAASGGVVVDGADDLSDPARWVKSSEGVWLAAGVTWAPAQVFADGARLKPSAAAPASLPPGSFTWVSGSGLYVNCGGGAPPAHGIRVGHRRHGFSLYARSWITIEGFTVTRTEDRGIHASDVCTNVSILGDTVCFANKMGIQVSGGREVLIGSNQVFDNNDHGISITNGATHCTIEDNECFRNARPGVRAANGIYLFGSPGNTLRRNRLHDNQDSGMNIQSGADDCVAYLNLSWNNGDHGYDHLGAAGTIHVCDVAFGNYKDGFSIEGTSPGTQIYNSIAADNGLTTNEFDLWVDLSSTPGFVSDHNLFWNSTRQPPVKYIAKLYTSVAAYSAASGQDAQSLQADPRFANPAGGDFLLKADSPAADRAASGGPLWSATAAPGCAHCGMLETRLQQAQKTRRP